jgi:hypothetical protein
MEKFMESKASHTRSRFANVFTVLVFSILTFSKLGLAGLLVAPTRLLLSDQQRVVTIGLRHVGKKQGKYRLSLIFNRMLPDGSIKEVRDPKSDERPALGLIKFSPRVAVLEPNVEQVVRVMVVPPSGLPDGEYRAHLLFEPTEDTEGEISMSSDNKDKKGIGMKLEAKVSVAVPVSNKHGKTYFKVKLGTPSIKPSENGGRKLVVPIQSEGNAFARGDLFIYFEPLSGPLIELNVFRSFPAYSTFIEFSTPLSRTLAMKLKNGRLKVELKNSEEGTDKDPVTLASTELLIP